MADMYSKEKRSDIMSKIHGAETKPEILVRSYLHSHGFRFRKNDKRHPGKPDIVLPKYRTIIFVHGCFWHGHKNCKASALPKTKRKFWEKKISDNIIRDKKNKKKLIEDGWKVIEIWQCEIKNKKDRKKRIESLINELKL